MQLPHGDDHFTFTPTPEQQGKFDVLDVVFAQYKLEKERASVLFEKAVEDLQPRFRRGGGEQRPCEDERDKVVKCYETVIPVSATEGGQVVFESSVSSAVFRCTTFMNAYSRCSAALKGEYFSNLSKALSKSLEDAAKARHEAEVEATSRKRGGRRG